MRKGVCSRSEAVESVFAILIRLELSSQVIVGLILGVLEVVFAVAGCLPHVERNARNRLLGPEVADDAVHIRYDAVLWLVLNDGSA